MLYFALTLLGSLFFPLLPSAAAISCTEIPALSKEVATLRELKWLRPVECKTLNRADFLDLINTQIMHDYSYQQMNLEAMTYKLLGLVPSDYDYESCPISDILGNIFALYYHKSTGTIILPDWKDSPIDIIVHELVHALQDQHFNLKKIQRESCQTIDSCLAITALIEGDALLTQSLFEKRNSIEKDKNIEEAKPDSISTCSKLETLDEQSFFPYGFGRIFAERLYKSGGFGAINETFHHIPRSSREIIHSNDYLPSKGATFKRTDLSLSSSVLDGTRKLIYRNTVGQYTIRLLLKDIGSKEKAILAAKGWKGDLLGIYKGTHNDAYSLVWKTAWENEKESLEFLDAIRVLLERQYGIRLNSASQFSAVWMPGKGDLLIQRNQSEVILVKHTMSED